MKAKFSTAASLVAGLALIGSANAASINSTFQVKLVVQASCEFNTQSIKDIDLGSRAVNATNIEASTEFRVQCTKGATPIIKLSSSDWKLENTDSNIKQTVDYKLYGSDNAEWDTNNPRPYTGNGQEQLYQVTAKVTNVGDTAGTFKDTVTVTVDF